MPLKEILPAPPDPETFPECEYNAVEVGPVKVSRRAECLDLSPCHPAAWRSRMQAFLKFLFPKNLSGWAVFAKQSAVWRSGQDSPHEPPVTEARTPAGPTTRWQVASRLPPPTQAPQTAKVTTQTPTCHPRSPVASRRQGAPPLFKRGQQLSPLPLADTEWPA
jgi:hypothetical protein